MDYSLFFLIFLNFLEHSRKKNKKIKKKQKNILQNSWQFLQILESLKIHQIYWSFLWSLENFSKKCLWKAFVFFSNRTTYCIYLYRLLKSAMMATLALWWRVIQIWPFFCNLKGVLNHRTTPNLPWDRVMSVWYV